MLIEIGLILVIIVSFICLVYPLLDTSELSEFEAKRFSFALLCLLFIITILVYLIVYVIVA